MSNLEKLNENKEKIISVIKNNGPSFPARIAREIGVEPLFVSAIMSELVSEKKLKMSNMKIGSSPIYLTEGQEEELENFTQYLNNKEKEAFQNLKKHEILEDEKQEPATRVALRKLKDFAVPVSVRINGETKLFWRFFSLHNTEIEQKIKSLFLSEKKQPKKKSASEKTQIRKETSIEEKSKKKETKKELKEHDFSKAVKDYLSAKDIEILEEISSKKKEWISKIRTDDLFGKQEFFLIAKDKKRINETDLSLAIQKAQSEKMPAVLISSGETDKKAQEYLKQWKNLIKLEKIKF